MKRDSDFDFERIAGADVESGIADFVRFRDQYLTPRLPQPPAEWKDLTLDFARINGELKMAAPRRRRNVWGAVGFVAVAAAAATYVLEVRKPNPPAVAGALASPKIAPRQERPAKVIARMPSAPRDPQRDPNLEVRIFAAIHQAEADLGDPIEVEFESGRWKVTALASDSDRSARLRQALGTLATVELILNTEPPPLDGTAIQPFRKSPQKSVELIFAPQLEAYFGSRAALVNVTDRALDRSQALLSRAYALQKLDQSFPQGVERALGSPERALLGAVRADHRRAAASARPGLDGDFGLLAKAFGLEEPAASNQHVALLPAAARWDRVLGVVLGGASTDMTTAQLKLELATDFLDLRQAIEALP